MAGRVVRVLGTFVTVPQSTYMERRCCLLAWSSMPFYWPCFLPALGEREGSVIWFGDFLSFETEGRFDFSPAVCGARVRAC